LASETVLYGLDFGTTTTYLARSTSGRVAQVLPLTPEEYVPSIAAFDGKEFHGGVRALELIEAGKAAPIASPKTSITNRQFEQQVVLGGQEYTVKLADAVVAILKAVVESAKTAQGIDDLTASLVNFGCPSSWDGEQRRLLLKCIQDAGFKKARLADIREEAIAGGLGYLDFAKGANPKFEQSTFLVFDMGGGTLDVALLSATAKGLATAVTVLASHGNDKAGDSLDLTVAARILAKLNGAGDSYDQANYVLGQNSATTSLALRNDARGIKESLTKKDSVATVLSPVSKTKSKVTVTRQELESDFEADLASAINLVKTVVGLGTFSDSEDFVRSLGASVDFLRSIGHPETGGIPVTYSRPEMDKFLAKTSVREEWVSRSEVRRSGVDFTSKRIDTVVLVGGMSRVPAVADRLSKIFPHAKIISPAEFAGGTGGPEKAVVLGLATQSDLELDVYRPPFDVKLSWTDATGKANEITVFEAYSSVWDSVPADRDFLIGHEAHLDGFDTDSGALSFHRPDGTPVEIVVPEDSSILQSQVVPGPGGKINLALAKIRPVDFKMYATGLIFVRDSNGRETALRTSWPEAWVNLKKNLDSQKLVLRPVQVLDFMTVRELELDRHTQK